MNILYQTSASATGGRTGSASVDDGSLTIALVTPRELGGPGGEGANPEQLFACGYAACFLSALRFIAGRRKVSLPEDSKVTAQVGIGARPDGAGFSLDVALSVSLPGVESDVAADLLQEAHSVCPYSHLAREGLDVRLNLAA
ncbi:organic hydroperoxide resistance protein [Croceibacterium ferulae]|uniref:organic hydroperoxide resistance protein n=1 Tax=Croceibacterium ferulae TaxID=1854641 RepID=UPI000EB2DC6D|nr:organic hydroperoxide resistance protein [Croceibacterium ferulae]